MNERQVKVREATDIRLVNQLRELPVSKNSVDAIRSRHTVSENRSSRLRHLQRLRGRRKIKGLSARQLWDRKNSQRATKQPGPRPAARQAVNDGAVKGNKEKGGGGEER